MDVLLFHNLTINESEGDVNAHGNESSIAVLPNAKTSFSSSHRASTGGSIRISSRNGSEDSGGSSQSSTSVSTPGGGGLVAPDNRLVEEQAAQVRPTVVLPTESDSTTRANSQFDVGGGEESGQGVGGDRRNRPPPLSSLSGIDPVRGSTSTEKVDKKKKKKKKQQSDLRQGSSLKASSEAEQQESVHPRALLHPLTKVAADGSATAKHEFTAEQRTPKLKGSALGSATLGSPPRRFRCCEK